MNSINSGKMFVHLSLVVCMFHHLFLWLQSPVPAHYRPLSLWWVMSRKAAVHVWKQHLGTCGGLFSFVTFHLTKDIVTDEPMRRVSVLYIISASRITFSQPLSLRVLLGRSVTNRMKIWDWARLMCRAVIEDLVLPALELMMMSSLSSSSSILNALALL